MYRSSARYVVLVCFLSSILASMRMSSTRAQGIGRWNGSGPVFPAVFAFGDSILDTGNNNDLLTTAKCNFPPYGKDFIGHRATGRFCNGRVPSDIIASTLRIKDTLPAYLSPELSNEDLLTGVCFASGGAGYDDDYTSIPAGAVSMAGQIELFKEYKEKLQSITDPERAAKIVRESFYIICAGSNDIAHTYYVTSRSLQYDIHTYTRLLASSAAAFAEELYSLGARNIVVLGLPSLGCIPFFRTAQGGIQRDCVDMYNEACQMFNDALLMELQAIQKKLSTKYIFYADIYQVLLQLVQHPSEYGFEVSEKGCCGTGLIEVVALCNKHTPTCTDDTKYVFWDSFHPTEKAYDVIVDYLVRNYMNIFL